MKNVNHNGGEKMKVGDEVMVRPFAENTTRRGYCWNCRVIDAHKDGSVLVEPIECDGSDSFVAVRGEYHV